MLGPNRQHPNTLIFLIETQHDTDQFHDLLGPSRQQLQAPQCQLCQLSILCIIPWHLPGGGGGFITVASQLTDVLHVVVTDGLQVDEKVRLWTWGAGLTARPFGWVKVGAVAEVRIWGDLHVSIQWNNLQVLRK